MQHQNEMKFEQMLGLFLGLLVFYVDLDIPETQFNNVQTLDLLLSFILTYRVKFDNIL